MPAKTILASAIADTFTTEIKGAIQNLPTQPLLVGFLANSDPAAIKYAEWTGKACEAVGIRFELRSCSKMQLEDKVLEANQDPLVNGIMVYYPVFGGSQDQYIQNIVSIQKDVEGLTHTFKYNMYHNIRFLDKEEKLKCIIPCTPLAMVKILEYVGVYNRILPFGNRLHGRTITIINRSEVVGRPLAALLANDGARVLSVDINDICEFHRGQGLKFTKHEVFDTKMSLDEALAVSDVVISGVPSESYKVSTSKLKEGVVAINFSSFKNFEDDIKSKASIYVPSVGKVTVAMLQRNLVRLYVSSTNCF